MQMLVWKIFVFKKELVLLILVLTLFQLEEKGEGGGISPPLPSFKIFYITQ